MRRGVFKPYTKAEVVEILRLYFLLSIKEAESETERLASCVVRDGLNAVRYLQMWEAKLKKGVHGDINELRMLYPYYQAIQPQKGISTDDLINSFRRVYPEREVVITRCDLYGVKGIIVAEFPDGLFYFVVSANSVSSAYRSLSEAQRFLQS